MSIKCDKCEIEFASSEVTAKCVDCKRLFHAACTKLGSVQNVKKAKKWKCDGCTDDTASVQSNDGIDKKFFMDALLSLKNDINENTDKKIVTVQESINSLSEDLKNLHFKVTNLEENDALFETRCSHLERVVEDLRGNADDLRQRLQDNDQHSRSANIEVVGLPLTRGEDLGDVICKIAGVIGVKEFNLKSVSAAHRLSRFSKKLQHPPIIIQFVSRGVKESWMAAVRQKKTLISTEIAASLPMSRVYLNHHLTGHNKRLLGRARFLQRSGKIHFAGFFNGKVLIKPKEGDNSIRVLSLQDLDKFDS